MLIRVSAISYSDTIPFVENNIIISDFCIGAEDKVASVLLCSGIPIEKIKTIYLDTESVTSALLTKVLAQHFWTLALEEHKSKVRWFG